MTKKTLTKNVRYLAYTLHAVAIPVGIWIGIQLYEWMSGTEVSFGFR